LASKTVLRRARRACANPNVELMTTLSAAPPASFAYKKLRPFSKAEFRFKATLNDYASKRLLPRLQARNMFCAGRNRYTGIHVRLANGIYLEAVLTNDSEWGGFTFDFARLLPANGGLYNLSIRRSEDWQRAESDSIASASRYFANAAVSPRASDWIPLARGGTFEECVRLLAEEED
jgi:hypothetical protein